MSLQTTDRLSDPTRRKKGDAVEAVKRTSEDDHRRKRRNRTTQSCLNCHTSKRMCDRKRPCGRCTQLGLTGLCIYEVDDPSPSNDTQDETLRLQKRVAELESIIRELKNKPHPRWIKSTKDAGIEKKRNNRTTASRRKGIPDIVISDTATPPPIERVVASSPTTHIFPDRPFDTYNHLTLDVNNCSPSPFAPASPSTDPISSPLLTPSSPLSPSSEHTPAPATQSDIGPDLSVLLSSYLAGQGGIEDNTFDDIFHDLSQSDMNVDDSHTGDHCGCLNDPTNYHIVLELSLRLRRAADMLTRFSEHESGARPCAISQGITELDRFASLALGNIAIPPELISPYSNHNMVANMGPHTTHSINFHGVLPPLLAPASTVTPSPYPLQSVLPWGVEGAATHTDHRSDSLMSWDPSRHRQ
ncbi:hypothetical protein BKA93DRAFT_246231 [Sparassis latifolia]